MVKIYLASKLHHANFARDLIVNNRFPMVTWTNRWQWFEGQVSDAKKNAAHFWENDFDDVDAADAVLVMGWGKDILKGALVEAGYGIAKGKSVLCLGNSPSFSTWQYSNRISEIVWKPDTSLDELFDFAVATITQAYSLGRESNQ